ncbi:MAG: hypothetical protein HOP17_04660 [Acidobacteria bacterium]|nr:hypothetical protein [Acidobacteriota bacterium]
MRNDLAALPSLRRQATLFLKDRPDIEHIRKHFNPVQAALISAHVTLLREDEVIDWDEVTARTGEIKKAVTLKIGQPQRYGDLVFLPCDDIEGSFRDIRINLLKSRDIRDHKPHITLIHPRNAACSDKIWNEIRGSIEPFTYTFREVSFILQENGGVWKTIRTFCIH